MRKGVLAGIGLVSMGMVVASTAAAEDWRACVVAACMQNACGDNGASVVVSMATDVNDPAVGGASGAQAALLRSLQQRGTMNGDPPMMQCTPSQPSQDAANQLSQNIFAQMSVSFPDVRLISPNDLFSGYDSVPGSEDPDYNGGNSSSGNSYGSNSGSGNDGSAERAQAQAQAEAEAEAQAAAAAREREAADAQRERERIAAETRRAEQQAAADEARRKAEARNQASTDTDANRCVSSPSLRQNDTFAGNTAAYVTNGCGTPVDVRICLMTESKGWNCGMSVGLAPQASWSWSSFHATGQVFLDARVNGSTRTLNSP